MNKRLLILGVTVFLTACGNQDANNTSRGNGHKMGDQTQKVAVKTPKIPFKYGVGRTKYREMCSSCHGQWGEGTEQGPPLMHSFYEPSHHGDGSFYNAVLKGVKAHHWKYGDMPPVQGATTKDVDRILPFLRWLQQQNGIF